MHKIKYHRDKKNTTRQNIRKNRECEQQLRMQKELIDAERSNAAKATQQTIEAKVEKTKLETVFQEKLESMNKENEKKIKNTNDILKQAQTQAKATQAQIEKAQAETAQALLRESARAREKGIVRDRERGIVRDRGIARERERKRKSARDCEREGGGIVRERREREREKEGEGL